MRQEPEAQVADATAERMPARASNTFAQSHPVSHPRRLFSRGTWSQSEIEDRCTGHSRAMGPHTSPKAFCVPGTGATRTQRILSMPASMDMKRHTRELVARFRALRGHRAIPSSVSWPQRAIHIISSRAPNASSAPVHRPSTSRVPARTTPGTLQTPTIDAPPCDRLGATKPDVPMDHSRGCRIMLSLCLPS